LRPHVAIAYKATRASRATRNDSHRKGGRRLFEVDVAFTSTHLDE